MTDEAVINNILIPTDLNPEIPESIPYSMALSQWTGAQLYILITYRLIENPQSDSGKKNIREYLQEQANKKIQLIRDTFPSECMNRCHFLLEIGFLQDRIRSNIHKYSIDLVIMNQGMERLLDKAHGLDKEIALTSFECPVLYVPPNKIAV
jgi:hypothetical protein